MPCATCGMPVEITDSDGATKEGEFSERWECVNGHTGRVSGEASEMPAAWNRSGPVFEEY